MPTTYAKPSRAVMINIAVSQLRRHPGRIVAVLLAVMISVGYLTATLSFVATETAGIAAGVTARTADADAVISSPGEESASLTAVDQIAERVGGAAGVDTAEVSRLVSTTVGEQTPMQLQSLPADQRLRWAELDQGSWPSSKQQIAIGRSTAEQAGISVGDELAVRLGSERTMTVSGITDETKSLFSGQIQSGFVAPSVLTDRNASQSEVLVLGDGSIGSEELAQQLGAEIGSGAQVQTSQAYSQEQVRGLTQGADIFGLLLLIFGAIALLVGAILIVNTFLILLAQRRQQVGLLRAVGATGSQVRRSMLVEAALTGVIGSVLGVGLGIGGSAIGAGISGSLQYGLVVPPTVLIAAAVGVVVTVLAALAPSARATRISPLEALRPVADAQHARRASILVGLLAAGLIILGGSAALYGVQTDTQALLLSIAGSMLIATGVLAGAKLYVPALLRLLGLVVRPFGTIPRLAVDNAGRNPGRAAATAAALMLAVGLIVTLQVGAASVRQSTSVALDAHYPVDVQVSAFDGPLPASLPDQVRNVDGVAETAEMQRTEARIEVGGKTMVTPVLSGADAGSAVNEGAAALEQGQLLMDPYLAESYGLQAGESVTVRNGSNQLQVTVQPHRIASGGIALLGPDQFDQLAPQASIGALWAKADPAADVTAVNAALTSLVENQPVQLAGTLTMKAMYTTLLDALLMIATALLGVAAVIALIGIGNTLGLSVIERSRESALLRALGLTRGQLRQMIMIEAVLLSVAGAAVGIAAGAFFGWLGTHALGLSTALEFPRVVFAMSVPQTAAVVAVAILAGVLASVLPGRRAARAAPVAALADG